MTNRCLNTLCGNRCLTAMKKILTGFWWERIRILSLGWIKQTCPVPMSIVNFLFNIFFTSGPFQKFLPVFPALRDLFKFRSQWVCFRSWYFDQNAAIGGDFSAWFWHSMHHWPGNPGVGHKLLTLEMTVADPGGPGGPAPLPPRFLQNHAVFRQL